MTIEETEKALKAAQIEVRQAEAALTGARNSEDAVDAQLKDVALKLADLEKQLRATDPANDPALRRIVTERGTLEGKQTALESRHEVVIAAHQQAKKLLLEAQDRARTAETARNSATAQIIRDALDKLVAEFEEKAGPMLAGLEALGRGYDPKPGPTIARLGLAGLLAVESAGLLTQLSERFANRAANVHHQKVTARNPLIIQPRDVPMLEAGGDTVPGGTGAYVPFDSGDGRIKGGTEPGFNPLDMP